MEVQASTALGEFLPDLTAEGADLEAEANDARLVGDAEQFDRVVDEAGRRGEGWRHISWYEQLARQARQERDMALLKSATSSIRIAAQREFHRREAGGADNRP